MPNTVHVIDFGGTVVSRAIWNEYRAVETVVKHSSAGQDVGSVPVPFRPARSTVVLRRAGSQAVWNLAKPLPTSST